MMTSYFEDYTKRFFFILGQTNDEYCTSNLELLNIEEILHRHLKTLGYQRVIFRLANRGFYCYDDESYRLAFTVHKKANDSNVNTQKIDLSSMGPLGGRVKKKKPSTTNNNENIKNNSLSIAISEIEMSSYINRYMSDKKIKTVFIFSDFRDFLLNTHPDILRDLALEFNAISKLKAYNNNIVLFIGAKSLSAEDFTHLGNPIWSFLTQIMFVGNSLEVENRKLSKNTLVLPAPHKDEIINILHYYRLRESNALTVDWIDFDKIVDVIYRYTKETTSKEEDIFNLKALNAKLKDLKDINLKEIKMLLKIENKKEGFEKMKELEGLDYLIKDIAKIVEYVKSKIVKKDETQKDTQTTIKRLIPNEKVENQDVNLHIAFKGNPGTGKTTVARIIAEIYKENELLDVGHLVEAKGSDLVAGYVGQTAIKTQEMIDRAMGGVLFIDEAYKLSSNTFGKEAIDTIVEAMTANYGKFAVIIAGYPNEIETFLNENPGLKSRFANKIDMKDYEPKVLENIFKNAMKLEIYRFDEELENLFPHFIKNWFDARDEKTFGNARDVLNLFTEMAKNAFSDSQRKILKIQDIPDAKKIYAKVQSEDVMQEALSKLDNIIGLTEVKENVKNIIASIKMEKLRNPDSKVIAGHYVLKGNPGTGKTTVARILGEILKELKVLPKGHFMEATRENLVQGFVGQTAIKTKEILDKSIGGVLFIDEAYSLSKGGDNDFGQEAIDTIVPFMENNLDKFSLIVAGYNEDMDIFLDANTGLQSRFTNTIIFEDYTEDELIQIFKIFAKGYTISNEIEERLRVMFTSMKSNSKFGNGRYARNLFNAIKTKMNRRLNEIGNLEIKDPRLYIIEMDDLPNDASL